MPAGAPANASASEEFPSNNLDGGARKIAVEEKTD
jgi:hypothetical protein